MSCDYILYVGLNMGRTLKPKKWGKNMVFIRNIDRLDTVIILF